MRRIVLLALAAALFGAAGARAADLKVMNSGAFFAVFGALEPGFEKAHGDRIAVIAGPSMGSTPQAIPNRLARGEAADVVIMARSSLDDLAAKGEVVPGSRTDLVRSKIALAVKAGAPKPDISTVEGLKRALLAARSVAYSDSASGVYLQAVLFKRLGIERQMAAKGHMIPARPVGEVVAAGQADLGFQQLSELKPIKGIDIVGPLPDGAQKVTVFSAGVVAASRHPGEARALIAYLASRKVDPVIRAAGLEPVNPGR